MAEKKKKEEGKTFAPVLPFDSSYGQSFYIYEHATYSCDRDLCHPHIEISTGNLMKYYTYHFEEEKTTLIDSK